MSFILNLDTRIEGCLDADPVRIAAGILRRDMNECLTVHKEENRILVRMDPSMEPERGRVSVTDHEITVSAGDALGAVYALLHISEEALDIGPFTWWYGLKPVRKTAVLIGEGTWTSPSYRVAMRGWFINDEVLLEGWCTTPAERHRLWMRLFETILRLGGNLVIPGTDRQYDGSLLTSLASSMGLTLAQHHAEMLGAPMFGRVYPDLSPSYSLYPALFEDLWRRGIKENRDRKVLWTVGFRGQGDHAFWDDDPAMDTDEKRGAFISKIILRQMEMVREEVPEARFCTYLYGEMMSLYRQGYLRIPPEVIRIWSDNGFGKMLSRRQGLSNPRTDAMPGEGEPGEHGIYYHAGFYDLQAANHITMLQVPLTLVREELKKVLSRNGNACWIINSGSVRPHLFVLELLARMWREGDADLEETAREHADRYLGKGSVGHLLLEYGEASVRYGPHADDCCGDQFYHFPVREMCHALCRGEPYVDRIRWCAPEKDFPAQALHMARIAKPGIQSWGAFEKKVRSAGENFIHPVKALEDSLLTAAILHRTGCDGVYSFATACVHALRGNDLQAFLWTDRALRDQREALAAMKDAEHGMFAHYYRNDCFTNVGLTEAMLEGMRTYFRIRGDGPTQYDWEKTYLIPASETRVTLQSHITRQLSEEELANGLREAVPLEEISE